MSSGVGLINTSTTDQTPLIVMAACSHGNMPLFYVRAREEVHAHLSFVKREYRRTDRQTEKQTGRQADRPTDRQTDRQTN